jgi:uncharacterized radical SAM superfamily Fe-S cluster-containing enzyme
VLRYHIRIIFRKGAQDQEHGSLLYENMFRIVIIAFMDAWNFDVRSAKKCCVHHVLPDGKIMPFCSYNTLHRPKYMSKYRGKAIKES